MKVERLSFPGGVPFAEVKKRQFLESHIHDLEAVKPGVHELNTSGMKIEWWKQCLVVDYSGRAYIVTPPSVLRRINPKASESASVSVNALSDSFYLMGRHKEKPGQHVFEMIFVRGKK